MKTIAALIIPVALAGCSTNYVPVQTDKLAVPQECKARHYADLPAIDPLKGPKASPEDVNKHWAAAHRLKSRPAYRRLYRDYRICSRYARGA